MTDVEIEFDSEAAEKWLDNIIHNTESAKRANKAYADALSIFVYRDVLEHFERETAPEGPWAAWSKAYDRHMKKIGKGSNKILQDSGRLRNTFTPDSRDEKKGGIVWYNNAKTASGFPYAAAHNEGGPTLPKREFMWLSDSALDKMAEASLTFILGPRK